ncbi:3-hydroxyisobutyryl-CoA hydrolase 1 [Acorus calamus]|uniref:3-hydroxyisobutyryl-CoA hydrolase n=1 Tax=Acorus calamus TaxID=4465 RepID=A0AAV9CS57_ACOCL|nr:3-hydroxyisobutyryl-CoA hydrolase 1 [Acorus calamus]
MMYRLDIIDRCFSKRTIEDIKSAIELEAIKGAEEWISAAIESLNKASPFSLKLSLRSVCVS